MARIEPPTIGVTRTVVEGVTVEQLARGPGHYPASPLPGQAGNVSIAGHRTTYGQPFHNIDKLKIGDRIVTTTAVRVLDEQGDDRLTLIACHPKYSLKQRIIVQAILRGKPAPELKGQGKAQKQAIVGAGGGGLAGDATVRAGIDGPSLSGRDRSATPAIIWGLASAGIWSVSWGARFLLRRPSAEPLERSSSGRGRGLLASSPYLIGFAPFMVTLYFFFENVSLLLPGNY